MVSYASEKGMGFLRARRPGICWLMRLPKVMKRPKWRRCTSYRLKPEEAEPVTDTLVKLMAERQDEIREAAYLTLWQLDANRSRRLFVEFSS